MSDRWLVEPGRIEVRCEACDERIEVGQTVYQTTERTVCVLCVTDDELAQLIGSTLR